MLFHEILIEADAWDVDAYHGTSANFDEFKNKRFAQLGYHFGSSPEQANKRIAKSRHGAQVMPVKLRLRNPLRVHDMEDWSPNSVIWGIRYSFDQRHEPMPAPLAGLINELAKAFHTMEMDSRGAAIQEITALHHAKGWSFRDEPPEATKAAAKIRANHARTLQDAQGKMLVDGLKKLGYDGIVYSNRFEGSGDSYLVFDSNQIRSRFAKFDPSRSGSGVITD